MAVARRRLERLLLGGLVAACALLLTECGGPGDACHPWREGTQCGAWRLVYNGYGEATGARYDTGWRYQFAPRSADRGDRTFAGLAVSEEQLGDLEISVRLRTGQQLRHPHPNPWEVAWLLWHYADDQHFYYVALKPNGWELGKEDPSYPGAQRYLATAAAPSFPVGRWFDVRVRQLGDDIQVFVDGAPLVHIRDPQDPYTRGSVGLYTEDAAVQFEHIRLVAVQPAGSAGR